MEVASGFMKFQMTRWPAAYASHPKDNHKLHFQPALRPQPRSLRSSTRRKAKVVLEYAGSTILYARRLIPDGIRVLRRRCS